MIDSDAAAASRLRKSLKTTSKMVKAIDERDINGIRPERITEIATSKKQIARLSEQGQRSRDRMSQTGVRINSDEQGPGAGDAQGPAARHAYLHIRSREGENVNRVQHIEIVTGRDSGQRRYSSL